MSFSEADRSDNRRRAFCTGRSVEPSDCTLQSLASVPLCDVDRRYTSWVYTQCMSRTNIDIDENACRAVMSRYHLATKREAVNLALRLLAAEPLDLKAARKLRGSGWEGDLDKMRSSRVG
jgi:Arc/MetJ family transcription regulator